MDQTTVSSKKFIEPIMIFIQLAYAISDTVITDLFIFKKCFELAQGNNSIGNCSILHENSSSEEAKNLSNLIQPHIATVLTLKSNIETFFPIILILFFGPWSDKNGRKPLLIYPFIGSLIYYSTYAVLSQFNFDLYYFLVPSTISSVMGGFPSIMMASFCYVADVTKEENRSWRLGLLDFMIFGGQLIGFSLSPIIFKNFGYAVVLASSAASCFAGLLYSQFFLDETIRKHSPRESVDSVFDFHLIKELFATVLRKRPNFDRCLIWCCLLIIALHDDMMQGAGTILYLFTKRFGWSLADFSYYADFQLIVTMCGMMILIKIIAPLFKLSETSSIIIASLSNGCGSVMKSFAKKSVHLYISTGIGLFCLAPASLVRSIISKTISEHDVGKAFAVTTTMEKIGPLAATPLFLHLHTKYITNYPCPVWFLNAGLSFFIVIIAIIVRHRWNNLKVDIRGS